MSDADRIRPPLLRWTDAWGWSPWLTGSVVLFAGLAIVALAAVFGTDFGPGGTPDADQELRVAIILALILAFQSGAQPFVDRRARQAFAGIRPLLDPLPVGPGAWEERATRVDRRIHRRATLLALLIPTAAVFLPEAIALGSLGLGQMEALTALHRIFVPLIGLMAGSTFASIVTSSQVLSEACRTQGRVQLFDTTPWRPLARLGLANAAVSIGLLSLLLLLVPDREAGVGLAAFLGGTILWLVVLAAGSVLLPMRGLRERIQQEKEAQLTAYRRELAELLQEPHSAPGRLSDLAAYGRLLENVQEWPVDLPQLGRLTLLLGLPLGSWVAAALVERFLDGLLG